MSVPVPFILLALTLAEIATFIAVGEALGVAATLALTVLATLAGFSVLRTAGLTTLRRAQAELAGGRTPAQALVDGAGQCVAALLLIVPGFLTDLLGLALLVPAVRSFLWRRIASRWPKSPARPDRRAAGAVVELAPGEYAIRHSAPDWDQEPDQRR